MGFKLTNVVDESEVGTSRKTSVNRKVTVIPYNDLNDLQKKAVDRTRHFVDLANKQWDKSVTRWAHSLDLDCPKISFDLRGSIAGKARGFSHIFYNLSLMKENWEDFWENTIPHEAAHSVVSKLNYLGFLRDNYGIVKPHGKEWKAVMRKFGCEPERCHNYDVSNCGGWSRPFVYKCECNEHKLTNVMHKRIKSGDGRFCRRCKATLKFIREDG